MCELERKQANHGRFHRRLTRAEWIAFALAVVIAHGFYWRIVLFPSDFDAKNYLDIAIDIGRNGLFSKFHYSNIRTYGYPLFLAVLARCANATGVPWGLWIFEIQLFCYILGAWALRCAIAGDDSGVPKQARWIFIALVLNVFALSYTPESLTESLSVSLLLFAAACWVRFRDGLGEPWLIVLAGSLLLGSAVMVRPSSVFAVGAWCAAIAAVCIARRMHGTAVMSVALAIVIGIALPMLPQVRNNVRHYGEWTPLVVAQLGKNQHIWGIAYIKYATAMPPVPTPSIFYENPLARGRPVDGAAPLKWYLQHPAAGTGTLALHTFNMLDQDLLFTYSRDLAPWYRVPLGILGHGMIALALVGIMLLVVGQRTRTGSLTLFALVVFVGAHLAVHAATAVEMRFGLPLLVLAGPLAMWAWHQLQVTPRRQRFIAAAFVSVYVVGALSLSAWVRQQAPSIRAWAGA